MKLAPLSLLHKFSVLLLAFLKPFGLWGVAGLAFIDSGLFPIPVSMDGVVIGYVAHNHHLFFIYSLIAAAASSVGSLIPFFIGRAGGELFLLKRINRKRYESIRDRFERQEFLAIMIPALLPPPTPLKLFEFAAGVFEMKTVPFLLAIFCGKFVQFLLCSVLVIWFGPALIHSFRDLLHRHLNIVLGLASAAFLTLVLYVIRKVFGQRRNPPVSTEKGA